MRLRLLLVLLLLPLAAPVTQRLGAADIHLRMDRLTDSLNLLKAEDRSVVDQAAALIHQGENAAALAQLSALTKANPNNSSVRILTAYALLQVGNVLGAFDEARKAEASPNGNSYKCWFLAKVALLAGDKTACRREIKHVEHVGDMAADVKALKRELKKSN